MTATRADEPRDRIVRDLQWSLASPPLAAARLPSSLAPAETWFTELGRNAALPLARLDQDPQPLHAAVRNCRDRRLGAYFETLLDFWLERYSRWRVVARRLPIHAQGRTLGEFDFLLYDNRHAHHEHWEVAVKFYLGVTDEAGALHWVGPGLRDQLARKRTHLLSHQIRLAESEPAAALLRERGIHIARRRILLKGRCFHPLRGQTHAQYWWATQDIFADHFGASGLIWLELPRSHWLAPVHPQDGPGLVILGETAPAAQAMRALQQPVCVAGVDSSGERTRGFLVPADWEHAARTTLTEPIRSAGGDRPGATDRQG